MYNYQEFITEKIEKMKYLEKWCKKNYPELKDRLMGPLNTQCNEYEYRTCEDFIRFYQSI